MSIAQLPLALRASPDQRFESFVAPPDGLLAQLDALARQPGADWLYLAGVAGTGKTHLALATCAVAGEAGRRVSYLPLQAVRGQLRAALDGQETYELVAIDGVEAVAGEREAEVALFDFHNRARSAGAAVLYTAQAAPDALDLVLPDLRSRLSQCSRVALVPLDDDGRREVLRERARRRGLVLEEAAIDWLLARSERDLDHLARLIDRLDRASLAAQRRVTVPFLRQVLAGE